MNKNRNAVELGRLGGLIGGPARAESLSAERRSEIAKMGAQSRWNKQRERCTCHCGNETCFCTGTCKKGCPVHDPLSAIKSSVNIGGARVWDAPVKPGMQDDDEYVKPCIHREHEPPTMMVIPPGKKYVHVCPGCGYTVTLRGSNVTF